MEVAINNIVEKDATVLLGATLYYIGHNYYHTDRPAISDSDYKSIDRIRDKVLKHRETLRKNKQQSLQLTLNELCMAVAIVENVLKEIRNDPSEFEMISYDLDTLEKCYLKLVQNT